jgi:signal transduction histidine kinase
MRSEEEARERAFARRSLAGYLAPAALALAFPGGFALAVMLLDRANRSLPSNALYVLCIESAFAAIVLFALGARSLAIRRRLARAMGSPLDAVLPAAGRGPEGAWKAFAEALRAEAARELARRDAEAKAELEAFLASVHALKTPATALSLMAQRSIEGGMPMPAEETRLEIDELVRVLDRALGRLRLDDFEYGSRIGRLEAGEALRESVKRHKRLLISRGISVEIGGWVEAETDPAWLGFILDQLLSNAAKYASSRISGRVGIEGGRCSIRLSDDGPGLDAEDGLRAFGKSASGSAARRDRPESGPASSGYGLYLAGEAAHRLGLSLEIGAGPEGGAEARLGLPLAEGVLDKLTEA